MADLGPVAQFLATIVIGIGSGIGAAVITTSMRLGDTNPNESMRSSLPLAGSASSLDGKASHGWA